MKTGTHAPIADNRPLAELSRQLDNHETSAAALTAQALARIDSEQGRLTFTSVFTTQARAQAEASDLLRAAGAPMGPLAGLPVSIKDLFDVAGHETRAGSRVLAGSGPAAVDATAVARLRAAGAILVGHTNMTEFAYSGLGLNPHYGTPDNPRAPGRIPGGSSSGAAVSVAEGMACAALATDTGGSVRIPAALCGLVGFKPTQRRVDTTGGVPLSRTLDSIGPIARTVACCALLDGILANETTAPMPEPGLRGLRLAVPQRYVLDDLDTTTADTFARTVERLAALGAAVQDAPFENLERVPDLQRNGGITAAEAYQWHRALLAAHGDAYDPRVRVRAESGIAISAADYLDLIVERRIRIAEMDARMAPYDALILPTTAIVAPLVSACDESDEQYARLNRLILRNTTVGNMLDLCAATVPCQRPGEIPVGLMIMGRSGADRRILAIAAAIEAGLGNSSPGA